MQHIKRLICLANSKRDGAICIAGKEMHANGELGEWIRPVGAGGEALKERECGCSFTYVNSAIHYWETPRLCDIVEIACAPNPIHPIRKENRKIYDRPWKCIGKFAFERLESIVDEPRTLWPNFHSSRNGRHDKVPVKDEQDLSDTLRLIKPKEFRIKVAYEEHNNDMEKRSRAHFTYLNQKYVLSITDRYVNGEYSLKDEGWYDCNAEFITVSLTEPFKGYFYKVVAGIFKNDKLS